MAKDFHSFCDHKGPTLTLLQIEDGNCIGGFTNAQWSSPEEGSVYKSDAGAMLFNLSAHESFRYRYTTDAISCAKNKGPHFGSISELSVESD